MKRTLLICIFFISGIASWFTNSVTAQISSWHLYKEAPPNVIPLQFSGTEDGVLYMLTTDKKIFYRLSNESEWEPLPGVYAFWNTLNIEVNPVTGTLYVGTLQDGVRYTSDFGQSWDQEYFFTNTNGFHATIWSIASSPDGKIYISAPPTPVGDFDFSTGVIYKSINDGNTWQQITDAEGTQSQSFEEMIYLEGGIILGGSIQGGIYKSDNEGVTWTFEGLNGVTLNRFAVDDDGIIYTSSLQANNGSEPGVYRSSDNGDTWSQINNGLPSILVGCVEYYPSANQVLCGTNQGVFILEDNQWNNTTLNLSQGMVNDLYSLNENIYVASELNAVQYEQFEIDSWENYNEGLEGSISDFIFLNNQSDKLLTGYELSPILSYNLEPSLNWENFNLNDISMPSCMAKQIAKNSNNDIFIVDHEELFRSEDGGESFENITPDLPIPEFGVVNSLDQIAVGGNNRILLLQGSNDMVFYHSSDNGGSFNELIDLSQFGAFVIPEAFAVASNGRYFILFENIGDGEIELITSIDGEIWEGIDISEILANSSSAASAGFVNFDDQNMLFTLNHQVYFLDVEAYEFTSLEMPWLLTNPNAYFEVFSFNTDDIYIIAYPTFSSLDYEGLWHSADNGESWTNLLFPTSEMGGELLPQKIRFRSDGIPVVNTIGDGLYYYGEEGVISAVSGNIKPTQELTLYPNPVRENSTFTLKGTGIFHQPTLVLMNSLGKQLPVNYHINNPYQMEVKISGMPAGIYFLHIDDQGKSIGAKSIIVVSDH